MRDSSRKDRKTEGGNMEEVEV